MANNDKENKIKKFTKEAIGKTLNQFNKEIGIADLVEINKNQDRILNGILSQVNDENTEKTEKSNIITLDNSTDGIVELKEIQGDTNVNVSKIEEMPITHDIGDKEGNVFTLNEIPKGAISIGEIQGNTMVNCNKEADKELILMEDLSTEGYSNITLDKGVNGGKVDIALEGNTMVNVCDQKDPVAITKSYTVETGNHVALQGEYDGKCRPVVTGNTLVNLAQLSGNLYDYVSYVDDNYITFDATDNTTYRIDDLYSNKKLIKPDTTYTIIIDVKENTLVNTFEFNWSGLNGNDVGTCIASDIYIGEGETGRTIQVVTSKSDVINQKYTIAPRLTYLNTSGKITFKVILLEGDYTNKPIPGYFEGLQSSFEYKVVPENLCSFKSKNYDNSPCFVTFDTKVKPNTKYTLYAPELTDDIIMYVGYSGYEGLVGYQDNNKVTFTTGNSTKNVIQCYYKKYPESESDNALVKDYVNKIDTSKFYLVEGDYTNYDFSDYDPTKAGKYKVDYVVTGKNKVDNDNNLLSEININTGLKESSREVIITDFIKVTSNYTCSIYGNTDKFNSITYRYYDINKNYLGATKPSSYPYYVRLRALKLSAISTIDINDIYFQLEEGSTATTYEPYKEYKKTFYLNSPLLEGDTIEQQGDNVVHVHRYGKVVLDGSKKIYSISTGTNNNALLIRLDSSPSFKGWDAVDQLIMCDKLPKKDRADINWDNGIINTINIDSSGNSWICVNTSISTKELAQEWLNENKPTLVYQLATPQYEVISQNDTILCDSYVNGHLDVDSVVPIEKIVFEGWKNNLKYLYPNTNYVLQFESDNIGILSFNLGSTLLNQSIVKGINKFNITTPSNMANTDMFFTGIGFNASNIVVTEATDQEFGYFEGMKSVGECEGNKIEILSRNKNLIDTEISNWTLGKCVEINTGKIYIDRNRALYDKYIPVTPGSKLMYTGYIDNNGNSNINGVCILQYDFNKKYLGYAWGSYNPTLSAKCRYIKIWVDNSAQWNQLEKICSQAQLEEGNISTERVPHAHNTQTLTHEPLRSVGDVKDKYVLIDGKWYIERNCGEVYLDPTALYWNKGILYDSNTDCSRIEANGLLNGRPLPKNDNDTTKLSNNLHHIKGDNVLGDKKIVLFMPTNSGQIRFSLKGNLSYDDFIVWLTNNPTYITYILATPTYEPIDYSPFTVYSDVTHISNNSTIPCNMVIKNTGYNCLLKPSTTYTVSSNLGLNTVTTGADIGDSCLRFYNEDTSNITTMKNVLILEGDWTSKSNLVPTNFSGIKSVFEQELVTDENNEHYGKYKITARVVGKNLFNKGDNWIKGQYLDGYDIIKLHDNAYYNPKYLKVNPNETYYSIHKDGTPMNISYLNFYDKNKNFIKLTYDATQFTTPSNAYYIRVSIWINNIGDNGVIGENFIGNSTAYEPYKESNIVFYIDEPLRGVKDVKDRIFIKEDKVIVERNCGSYTFDGSEEFGGFNISGNGTPFAYTFALTDKKPGKDNYMFCDRLKCFRSYAFNTPMAINGDTNTAIYIMLNKSIKTLQDFKQWLQQNPITVVYQLAEPTYEEVKHFSNRLILDTFNNESFNNSTLFLDTNISPKLSFKPLYEELVYVKNSTKYYIQFNAVGSGEVVINLGGTELTTEIVEGYNCIPITTPSESTNLMTISGQGITISEVVVSEVICGGYYKGLQSCFEEHMENGKYVCTIRGIALDGSKVNGIKLYINEPLRGIGNNKDRLCIKDGKLMVERKCGEVIFDGSNYIPKSMDTSIDTKKRWLIYQNSSIKDVSDSQVTTINDKYCDISANDTWYNKEGISQNSMQHAIHIYLERYSDGSDESKQALISELQQNPITVVYELAEPVYEEATNEYGLPIVFEGYENGIVYIDSAVTPTTHIKYTSNNQLATTLAEAEEQNITTQEDINMNVITYMMDIDMMLTDMEMSNDISVMAVRRDNSNENMLDRMSDEDKKVYRGNTVVMLEKMITANVLEKEDIEGRINMYYDKNRISKEQYEYLKSLL